MGHHRAARGTAWRLRLGYTSDMALVGRRLEMAEVERLLECAATGQGGVLAITGPPGRAGPSWLLPQRGRPPGAGSRHGRQPVPPRWSWSQCCLRALERSCGWAA